MLYNGLKQFAKKCDKLYCYGTGTCGKLVARYCKKFHIKIEAFIVTEKGTTMFKGKPVYALTDVDLGKRDGVIIGVSNTVFREEITALLTKHSASKKWYFVDTVSSISRYYYRLYKKSVRKRKHYNIFDSNRLSVPIPLHTIDISHYPREMHCYLFYGYRKCIVRRFRNIRYDFNLSEIQHGAPLMITKAETNPPDGNVFSFSGYEWKNVKDVKVYSIGPYIRYVHPSHTVAQIKRWKNSLGRILLVVPDHSTIAWDTKFDTSAFILEIEKVKEKGKFDSVIVCLYCADILRKYDIPYRKKGYRIVTAGYATDENFSARLKTFIYLADMVFSNGITTFIGFSVAMGKPVYIHDMHVLPEKNFFKVMNKMSFNPLEYYLAIKNEVIGAFNVYDEQISDEQIAVIKKYWGDWKGRFIQ